MITIAEEIEGNFYIEIVLTAQEMKNMIKAEMVEGSVILRKRKYYIAVRIKGEWDDEQEEDEVWQDENWESV